MKKYLFNALCILALLAVTTPVMADDCSVTIGAARILYQQQKWEIAKMECEMYLKDCGYDAEVKQMLDDCNRHLNGNAPAPVSQSSGDDEEELSLFGNPAPAPAPAPQPAPQPAQQTSKSSKQSKSSKPSQSSQPTQPVVETGGGFGLELEEEDAAPAPAPTPQPVQPTPAPEPEPELEDESEPIYTPEPAPVYTPQPEPVYTPEPEPVYIPEPEPEPEPEMIMLPEPEPEPVQVVVAEPEPIQAQESVKEEEPIYTPEAVEKPKKEIIFKVSQSFLEFPEQGGESRIDVTSDEGWKVTDKPSWVTIQRKDNTLTIKVAANERFTAREGDIVLTNDNYVELRVVVAQERNSDYINLSAQLIDDTEGDGGRYTIKVSCNKTWKIGTLPEWCIVEPNGESLSIRLGANKSGAARQTQIVITANNSVLPAQVITVKQAAIHDYIVISPNIITSSGKSSIATVRVETDKAEYHIQGLPQWCSIKKQTAKEFIIEIADNSGGAAREAQCDVTIAGGKSEKLIIRQEDRLTYITVSPKIITASKRGGTITVNVKSSGAWRVVNLPDWLQVTAQTDNTFTLSIDENKINNPRRVSFSVSTGGVRESIEVRQE